MAKKSPAAAPAPSVALNEELLTLQQVQDALRCSRPKIYSLAQQGRLHLVKFDRSTRITGTSLRDLIREIAARPVQLGKGRP